jgi:hypothetical protein
MALITEFAHRAQAQHTDLLIAVAWLHQKLYRCQSLLVRRVARLGAASILKA